MFTITNKAIEEFKGLLAGEGMPEKAAIRVFAKTGGCCSSNQLGIEVADLSQNGENIREFNGLNVVIDPDAVETAEMATIDFYDDPERPGFKVLWDKESANGGSCGCH